MSRPRFLRGLPVIFSLALAMLLLSACGGRTAAWDAKGELPEREEMLLDEAVRLTEEGDAFWEQRPSRERIADALARWEQAVAIDPEAHEVHERIARAYYELGVLDAETGEEADGEAQGQVEEEHSVGAAEAGIRAAELGLMAISPDFGERMRRGANLAEGLEVLGPESAELLLLYALNLEKWLESQSKLVNLQHRGWVELALQRVKELDEGAAHAALHRRAFEEKLQLGELDQAREHLEQAIALSPNYLPARVLMAEKLAIPAGDRAAFEEQVSYVLQAEPEALPDRVPENAAAKERARTLLARIDDYFEPVPEPAEEAPVEEAPSEQAPNEEPVADEETEQEETEAEQRRAVEVFVPAGETGQEAAEPGEAEAAEEQGADEGEPASEDEGAAEEQAGEDEKAETEEAPEEQGAEERGADEDEPASEDEGAAEEQAGEDETAEAEEAAEEQTAVEESAPADG